MIIDRRTGQPINIVTPPQQTTLSLGQAIAGALFVIGAFGLISDLADELWKSLSPPKRKPQGRIVEEDELSDLEWIFSRTNGLCFYCGKKLCANNRGYFAGRGACEIDHLIPFSRGGADQPYNLVPACVGCNREKSDMWPWEFDERFRVGDRNPDNYV